jgi:4-hydroxybenzoate polyprenyltransferase
VLRLRSRATGSAAAGSGSGSPPGHFSGRFRSFVAASHPEPTVAVTAVTTALAVAAGRGTGTAWVAAALLSGQLSIGWSNDWIDAERDRRVARTDKPVARGELAPEALRRAALLALTACVPLSLAMGVRAGVLHLAAVAAAWAYNTRLKSTALSWAPYAFAFGAIPSIVTLGLPQHPWAPAWATSAGALLGVGAHLANVLPDLADDAETGVRGLPHRLGAALSGALCGALLLAATALLVLGPPGAAGRVGWLVLVLAAVLVAAGLSLARRPGSDAAFRAAIAVAVVDVALLLLRGSSLT